ncbi:phosphodiester glycosidase family protein [Primorskyibacter sp. S87]|uniref:phosphodiester glycosidase family protein n=1 Tax=Primorskyibacter sp. S87 TaxID=3415126 RepID=UPI003C7B2692
MIRAALVTIAGLAATPLAAVECRDLTHDDNAYTVCDVDTATEDLRLFLNDEDGTLLGQFSTIDVQLEQSGETLVFAMNAGMYHSDRSPVGHYVENREETMRVITNAGPGNFGLLPNGVFCIRENRADVFETLTFVDQKPDCRDATQSGPMLVIDGELHPRFLVDSNSRYIRNGVGTNADGSRAVFAISHGTVTFHEFGRLFRDELEMAQALYFDGNISRLYAPQLRRHDAGFAMGPVVGVVRKAQ